MHATTITEFSWRISLPRSQSRRRPKNAFRQRRRFSGLRESHRRDVANLPDANLCFLHFVEPLARCRPAGVRRRPFRIHATNYEHACQTMEGTSARDWVWPFVPGPLQVFSRGNRGLFLPSRPLCRAKRACAANLVARAEDWLWSSLRPRNGTTQRFQSSPTGRCPGPPTGSKSSTNRSPKPNWMRSDERFVAVVPSAAPFGPPRPRSNSKSIRHYILSEGRGRKNKCRPQ